MIAIAKIPLPRPKDISPKEIFKIVGKTLPITVGIVVLLALTIIWALATTAITVFTWMVEQITQPGPPKTKRR